MVCHLLPFAKVGQYCCMSEKKWIKTCIVYIRVNPFFHYANDMLTFFSLSMSFKTKAM